MGSVLALHGWAVEDKDERNEKKLSVQSFSIIINFLHEEYKQICEGKTGYEQIVQSVTQHYGNLLLLLLRILLL